MLGSSESRVPKILSQIAWKPNRMNSNFYLNKAKESSKNNNYPEAFENFVNYFDSLEDPSTSATSVQLGFTKLVCRIGVVLEEVNDTEELLKVYLQALNFFPNNYIILNNLGGYLFKMGQIDIARTYLDKALACSKSYLPAEKNLMHCKWRQVPRWHFKMLNDSHRNMTYYQAIKDATNKGYRNVIDIGAGCGLLSLMASECANTNVLAIEENKVLAKMCENVMKENDRNNVRVLNCRSTKLIESPTTCDLLVTEIFDCAIFGEKMLDTLIHAHQTLITEKNDYKIVPCAARLFATAINYRDAQNFRVVNEIPELNLTNMCIRQYDPEPYEAEDLSLKNIDYLSAPVRVFNIDFYDIDQLEDLANNADHSMIIEFECLQDAVLTSIAVWFELDVDENITITTDPRCKTRVKCWEQGVCHLVHPIEVKRGERVQFEVTLLDSQLKFYQITKPSTCVSCWLVTKEVVSLLNDAPLIEEIINLARRFEKPEFINKLPDPEKAVMDLMSFPLLGFLLAASQGTSFYTAILSEKDFQNLDFFEHVLHLNKIPQAKLKVVENMIGHYMTMCGIHKYLTECKACVMNPINADGSVNDTIALKDEMPPPETLSVLIMPTKIVVKVVLIYSDQLEQWNRVNDKNVLNYKIAKFMNEYTGSEHPELDSDFTYKEYSSPISFTVDDKDYVKKSQNILITDTGHVNALYSWYDIQFYGTIDISTKDSKYIKKTCYLLNHRPVEFGELYRVAMRREGTYLDFRLDD